VVVWTTARPGGRPAQTTADGTPRTHRGAADDSRFWGPVSESAVLDRAVRCLPVVHNGLRGLA
jgi:hypothetical protein